MGSLKMKVIEIEKEEITKALRESRWIMARAARMLGITERMIAYKIRKYGIRKEEGGQVSKGLEQWGC
jgi:two-component system, NtrC family, response regulator AtoC